MGMDYCPRSRKAQGFHLNWTGHEFMGRVLDQLGADLNEWAGTNDGYYIRAATCLAWAGLLQSALEAAHLTRAGIHRRSDIAPFSGRLGSAKGPWSSPMVSSSDTLKGIFAPGDTVPVILRHVSRSGAQRTIDVLDPNNLQSLASEVSSVLGLSHDSNESGVIVRGGGMDMLFKLVYDLGLKLYGDGYALTYNEL